MRPFDHKRPLQGSFEEFGVVTYFGVLRNLSTRRYFRWVTHQVSSSFGWNFNVVVRDYTTLVPTIDVVNHYVHTRSSCCSQCRRRTQKGSKLGCWVDCSNPRENKLNKTPKKKDCRSMKVSMHDLAKEFSFGRSCCRNTSSLQRLGNTAPCRRVQQTPNTQQQ